jgi:hypothetical protein
MSDNVRETRLFTITLMKKEKIDYSRFRKFSLLQGVEYCTLKTDSVKLIFACQSVHITSADAVCLFYTKAS